MFNKLVHIKLLRVIRGALHRISGRRAAVALIVALSAPLLIASTGLSVDIGYWYQQQTALQSAADSAALAAATSDYNYLSTQTTTANTVSSTTAQAAGTTAADSATSSQFSFASQSSNLNVVPASAPCPTGASCTAPTSVGGYTTGMQYTATVSAPRTSFFSNMQGMGLTGMFGGSLNASATAVVSANISVTGDSCLLANPKNGNNTGVEIVDNGGGSSGGIYGSGCTITVNCPDGTAFQAPNSAGSAITAQNIVVAGKCTGGVGYSNHIYTTADTTPTANGPNGVQTVSSAAPDPLASMGDALGDAFAKGVSGATEATWQSDCSAITTSTSPAINITNSAGTLIGICEPSNPSSYVFNSTAPSVPYFFPLGLNSNSSITFGPGIYYFGGPLGGAGNGTVTGTGATLVFVGSASFNLTGSKAVVNLSAPDSSTNPNCVPPAQYPDGSIDGTHGNGICGVLIYQGRLDSSADSLGGDTASTVTGIIYTPDAQLTFSGNGGFNAGTETINGVSQTGTLAVLASSVILNGNGHLNLSINGNDNAGALLSKTTSTAGTPTAPLLIQ